MKTKEQYDDNEAQTRMVNAFCNAADGERLDDMVRAVIEIMHRVDRASVAAGFIDTPFFGNGE